MTTWRHAQESLVVAWCMAPGHAAGYCACTTPTPDPDSPCGYVGCRDHIGITELVPIGRQVHPHVPTRCTCGHPITEATR